MNKINEILEQLYPSFSDLSEYIETQINEINCELQAEKKYLFDEKDCILITYPDQFSSPDRSPLATLNYFIKEKLQNKISAVHILPFHPWSSDDGFSPLNYHDVEETYGTWGDLCDFELPLMVDCIFNHMSSKSEFFQKALKGDDRYLNMFHTVSEQEYEQKEFQENITKVIRPRTSPLFVPYIFGDEKRYVWATFSEDQIDTNLENREMVYYIVECLFNYIKHGAKYFRIDAVPFLWKELGTSCSHLEKTHLFVKLLRAIVDEVKQNLIIITESNVPHKENITYWGNGSDEAHIVYNFSLSPLLVHAFHKQDSTVLSNWANDVFECPSLTTFLNFTSTHDGIGVRGLEGLVPKEEVQELCDLAISKNGMVGYKTGTDNSEVPYELNISWASLMFDEDLDEKTNLRKLINSHALIMYLPGVPAHYIHNFLGTFNWNDGVELTGIKRTINRKKHEYTQMIEPSSNLIIDELLGHLNHRQENSCFHPKANFVALDYGPEIFAFQRKSEGSEAKIIFNLTNSEQKHHDKSLLPFELKVLIKTL